MAVVWAIGEIAEGVPTKLSLELATLARQLAEKSGGEARTVFIGEGASGAAASAEAYSGGVLALDVDAAAAVGPVAAMVAPRLASLMTEHKPDVVLVGASNDGKDIAGLLVGLTDMPVLVSGSGVDWADGGPTVEMSTFGGKLVTHSAFNDGRGFVVLHDQLGITLANLCSSSAGMTFSFVANGLFTFKAHALTWRHAALFVASTGLVMWVAQPLLIHGWLGLLPQDVDMGLADASAADLRMGVAKLTSISCGLALNYVAYRYVVWPRADRERVPVT